MYLRSSNIVVGTGFMVALKEQLKKIRVLREVSRRLVNRVPFNYVIRKYNRCANTLSVKRALVWKLIVDITGTGNHIEIGQHCIVKNLKIYVVGNNNRISIGSDVIFKSGIIWIEGNDNEVLIGANTTVESADLFVTENSNGLTIGEDCMLAENICFRTGDSHPILDRLTGDIINSAQSISIGRHNWLGEGVTLLKGATLPDDTIVATKSVVTRKFSDSNSIIGGVPAKKIKDNVTWLRSHS